MLDNNSARAYQNRIAILQFIEQFGACAQMQLLEHTLVSKPVFIKHLQYMESKGWLLKRKGFSYYPEMAGRRSAIYVLAEEGVKELAYHLTAPHLPNFGTSRKRLAAVLAIADVYVKIAPLGYLSTMQRLAYNNDEETHQPV